MANQFSYNLKIVTEQRLINLRKKSGQYFERLGEQKILELANFVLEKVPAYVEYLKASGQSVQKIENLGEFKKLPVISKEDYLRKYDYVSLFPGCDLSNASTVAATSGSTGEPFYLPRGEEQDRQYEYVAEVFFKNQFDGDKKRTLAIIGFGLGIWIGGIFTYKVFNKLAERGYKISLIPVGPQKELYLRSLKKFGHLYDQIILMGYPPFIKDIIDEAPDYGINWQDYRIKILTATESFSEEFRDYLAKKAGIKNIYKDIINIYGTVEFGTMAHETALTTLIRKIAIEKTNVFRSIFSSASRLPTLAQYYPYIVYFEEKNGEVLGSGYGSAIPLLRYRFPDKGGVIPFDTMVERLFANGIDIIEEAKKEKIEGTILRLPFVYVYERSDMAATLFGINIYPEYIKHALEDEGLVSFVTGKFTMITKTNKRQDQFLEINMELRKGVEPNAKISHIAQKTTIKSLLARSTEYNHLYGASSVKYRARLRPKIVLWPYEDLHYFAPGGKQKWVQK